MGNKIYNQNHKERNVKSIDSMRGLKISSMRRNTMLLKAYLPATAFPGRASDNLTGIVR